MPRRKTVTIDITDILPPPVPASTVTQYDDEIFPSVLPIDPPLDRFLNSIWAVRLPVLGTALLVLTALIAVSL